MTRLVRWVLMMVMMTALAGCAAWNAERPNPVAGLPYHHSDFDLKVAWKTSLTDEGLVVEGLIKNVRYAYMRDLDVTVALLDREKRVLAEHGELLVPVSLYIDYDQPFSVVLRDARPAPGDLLRFRITYRAVEGADSIFNWLSIFTVDAATGAAVEKVRKPLYDW
jgi:hypothetical protein